jgi:hypothetical protein
MARRRKPMTAERREAAEARKAERLNELHTQLSKGVQELQSGQAWQAWLDTASKFHRYSFNNQMLIALQEPTATLVPDTAHGRTATTGRSGAAKRTSESWPP